MLKMLNEKEIVETNGLCFVHPYTHF